MQKDSNAAEKLTSESTAKETPASSGRGADERIEPFDGGLGPLDSDDIDFLRESGLVWAPGNQRRAA